MKVIGLVGGSGSGKGCVCELLSEYSTYSIDTDRVYHEITSSDSPCLRELVSEFGEAVVGNDGALDRAYLRSIVFGTSDADEKREMLNKIAHKHILNEVRKIILQKQNEGLRAVIVDAPLLYESGFDAECDVTVCVIADEDVRIERIVLRDGISVDDAVKRIRGQLSNDELAARSDFVIENNGDLDELRSQLQNLIKKINI